MDLHMSVETIRQKKYFAEMAHEDVQPQRMLPALDFWL
jgi:hypothetical protein